VALKVVRKFLTTGRLELTWDAKNAAAFTNLFNYGVLCHIEEVRTTLEYGELWWKNKRKMKDWMWTSL
jgi:uncharacterized protein YegJ (DUF2314 family)